MNEKELAIMNEAFMIGRIYAANGEKETPAEIHDKLMAKCEIISKHSSPNTEAVKEIQEKFSNWSKKNFGEPYQTGYRNLLGCMEELGELSHAHLKGEQNIRHTPEEIIELKKDAIGDIFVFLCNYADSQGLQVSECIDKAWNEIKDRDWTNSLPTEE